MYIEFYEAKWCAACHGIMPHVISACKDARVKMDTIDADAMPDYCVSNNISSLPAIIIRDDEGKEIDRIIGSIGKHELLKRLADCRHD